MVSSILALLIVFPGKFYKVKARGTFPGNFTNFFYRGFVGHFVGLEFCVGENHHVRRIFVVSFLPRMNKFSNESPPPPPKGTRTISSHRFGIKKPDIQIHVTMKPKK